MFLKDGALKRNNSAWGTKAAFCPADSMVLQVQSQNGYRNHDCFSKLLYDFDYDASDTTTANATGALGLQLPIQHAQPLPLRLHLLADAATTTIKTTKSIVRLQLIRILLPYLCDYYSDKLSQYRVIENVKRWMVCVNGTLDKYISQMRQYQQALRLLFLFSCST